MAVSPTGQQLKELAESDTAGPVVMMNLLRFKPQGGAESYELKDTKMSVDSA
jgi:hypothetical protein